MPHLLPRSWVAPLRAAAVASLTAALVAACGVSASKLQADAEPASHTDGESPTPTPTPGTTPTGQMPADVTDEQIEQWIADNRLAEAPTHGMAFETMVNNLWRDGAPDVLLLGDSMTQQGVDPAILGDALAQQAGQSVRVFNAASSRARWGVNRLVVRYAERHDVLPKVAVIGISTRAAEGDLFYRDEVSREPLSSVVEGCDRDWRSAEERRCVRDREDLLFRFRSRPDQVAQAQAGVQLSHAYRVDADSILRPDGYLAHPSMTVAQVEKTSDQRMKRGFPGYPTIHDEAKASFKEMVGLLRENGVTVLAFEIPYPPPHQANLEAAGRGYDAKRQQSARRLAASADVPLFEVDRFGDWWGDGSSRDALHLAPKGAAGFARQLAEMDGFSDTVVDGL
ncbi:MAG: SGNH/GDSL hydrolase family protein [Nocardioidaceae bacterium]